MILQERYLAPSDARNIFRMIAEELDENVNTQVIICNDILKALISNKYPNVSFHNDISIYEVNEWYTLHKSNVFSLEIARLEIRKFGKNYSQLIKFNFDGYSFSDELYNLREYDFWHHDIQRFLIIEPF